MLMGALPMTVLRLVKSLVDFSPVTSEFTAKVCVGLSKRRNPRPRECTDTGLCHALLVPSVAFAQNNKCTVVCDYDDSFVAVNLRYVSFSAP